MSKEEQILSDFGLVRTCKVVSEQVATIVLTDGFSNKWSNVSIFMDKCKETFPNHPKIETAIIEENLAIVVLTK